MSRRPGARPGTARGCAGGLLCGALAGLAAALALGCASPGPAPKPTTLLAGNRAQTLVILPLNVPAVMPPELEAASPEVWQELEVYLRAEGKELKTVAFPVARQLWLAAIHRVRAAEKAANAEKGGSAEKGAKTGFDDAARELVLELARHAAFDGVIFPSLFARQASIDGSSARWDSVERAVEFEIERRASRAGSAPPPVEGVAPAASLHAVVFDAQGNKVQEGVRGIDLLVRVRVSESASSPETAPTFEYTPRADPFENRAHLRDAIAQVLAPFLPALPEAP